MARLVVPNMTHKLTKWKNRPGRMKIKDAGQTAWGCTGCDWLTIAPLPKAARAHREHVAQVERDAELEARVDARLAEEVATYA